MLKSAGASFFLFLSTLSVSFAAQGSKPPAEMIDCQGMLMQPEYGVVQYVGGKPIVPDHIVVPLIVGDGIGPEVSRATQAILDAAVRKAYGLNRTIQWLEIDAGVKAIERSGSVLPPATLEVLKKFPVALKGPLETPVGQGFRSVNVTLRQMFDLYSCVRPVQYFTNVPSPLKRPELVNMVIFRENTEDVYAGYEFEANSPEAKALVDAVNAMIAANPKLAHLPPMNAASAIGLKPVTEAASKRHVRRAIEYALANGFRDVTLVHKGNIMKHTEGAFLNWGYEVARNEFGGKIVTEDELWKSYGGKLPEGKILVKDRIADNMLQQTKLKPEAYGVVVTMNLNGDLLSDDLAALVGGLGVAPGANIGDRGALFEATHGTAPDIAGKNLANPTSLVLSGAMMLEYLGWTEARNLVYAAVQKSFADKVVTGDLGRGMAGATIVGTTEFTQNVIRNIGN